MSTTEENRAIREAESRAVAQDAAEAYKAALSEVKEGLKTNANEMNELSRAPLSRDEYHIRARRLRAEARDLVKRGRDLNIPVSHMAKTLGVSRQTVHEWINE